MAEILFSDILGTLIRESIIEVKEYGYNSYEKEFDICCRIFNEYLKNNNYVALVTSTDAHFHPDTLLFNVLVNFQSRIDKDLRDRFLFYAMFRDDMLEYILRRSDVKLIEEQNTKYLETDNGIKLTIVDGKVDAVDLMLEQVNENDLFLRGIADDISDIDMLAKITDLGGNSNLICHTLNVYRKNADEIIKEYYDNIKRQKFSEIYDKYPNRKYPDFNPFATPEYEELSKWYPKEKERIYNLLNEGKLDIEEIFIKSKLLRMICGYHNMSRNPSQNSNICKRFQVKNVKSYIDSLSVYPTFEKYAEEVLHIVPKNGKI